MGATRTQAQEPVLRYPNRERAASRATKAAVVVILIATVGLMLAVMIGGWSKLEGMIPVSFLWCAAYLVIALYVGLRWARGLLPIATALALLLLVVSIVAGAGLAGTSWFDRTRSGYAAVHSLFGGAGFSPDTLGVLTLVIAPVQALLIVLAMHGFSQSWNVEVEVPAAGAPVAAAPGSAEPDE